MRIRKRWLPPPPLVSPPDVLSSTPQVSQPPLQPSITGHDLRLLEHLQPVKVSNISGWDCPNHNNYSKAKNECSSDSYSNEEPPTHAREEEESTSKDNKFSATKQSVRWYKQKSAAETQTETSPTSSISSSLSYFGSWSEEEKAFPLKKRRASFIRLMLKNEATRKQEKEEMGKKSTSTGAIANDEERCGRSNGKKWKCWQSALEGYAQCEYHLNQERVRNMRHVCKQRQAAQISSKAEKVLDTSLCGEDEFNCNDDDDDDDYGVGFEVGKVGLVKARSITSFY
ncbi:uncharacterized protein LOC112028378 isoform X2 [Quercus suber]|uniref:uncharacterized protein LOC112028378 isoform X2 n=1 Tax=Quercus suber TaxID=58331 RepID=UPI0032E0225B